VSSDVGVYDVAGELRAESVSGDVTVSNAENFLLAKSVSGAVTIQSATSQKEPEIGSVSGDVRVSELSARGVTVSSVSGDVVLTDADCERASVESVSGAIRYGGNLAPGGRYEFQSHSGSVVFQIANEIGFELAAKTFSGRMRVISRSRPMWKGAGRVTSVVSMVTEALWSRPPRSAGTCPSPRNRALFSRLEASFHDTVEMRVHVDTPQVLRSRADTERQKRIGRVTSR